MKCAISGQDINAGDLIITVTRHLQPGEGAPVLVSAVKKAFNNTTVTEELRAKVRKLEVDLGADA